MPNADWPSPARSPSIGHVPGMKTGVGDSTEKSLENLSPFIQKMENSVLDLNSMYEMVTAPVSTTVLEHLQRCTV